MTINVFELFLSSIAVNETLSYSAIPSTASAAPAVPPPCLSSCFLVSNNITWCIGSQDIIINLKKKAGKTREESLPLTRVLTSLLLYRQRFYFSVQNTETEKILVKWRVRKEGVVDIDETRVIQ